MFGSELFPAVGSKYANTSLGASGGSCAETRCGRTYRSGRIVAEEVDNLLRSVSYSLCVAERADNYCAVVAAEAE